MSGQQAGADLEPRRKDRLPRQQGEGQGEGRLGRGEAPQPGLDPPGEIEDQGPLQLQEGRQGGRRPGDGWGVLVVSTGLGWGSWLTRGTRGRVLWPGDRRRVSVICHWLARLGGSLTHPRLLTGGLPHVSGRLPRQQELDLRDAVVTDASDAPAVAGHGHLTGPQRQGEADPLPRGQGASQGEALSARGHQDPKMALGPAQQGGGRLAVDLDPAGQPLPRLSRQGDTHRRRGIHVQLQPQLVGRDGQIQSRDLGAAGLAVRRGQQPCL